MSSRIFLIKPLWSAPGRFGSRPNTLSSFRSPVALAGLTGFPARFTVGVAAVGPALATPGKKRKGPRRAVSLNTKPVGQGFWKEGRPPQRKKKKYFVWEIEPAIRPP